MNEVILWSVNRHSCPLAGSLVVFADSEYDARLVAAYYHGGTEYEYTAMPVPVKALEAGDED